MVDWYYQNKRGDYFEIVTLNPENVPFRIFKKQFFALPTNKRRDTIGNNEICRLDFIIEKILVREFSEEVLDKIIFRWGASLIVNELEKEFPEKELKFPIHSVLDFNEHNWFLKYPKLCSYRKKQNSNFICSINLTPDSQYAKIVDCEKCNVLYDFERCVHLAPSFKRTEIQHPTLDSPQTRIIFSNDCELGKDIKAKKNYCDSCEAREPIFLTIDSFTTESPVEEIKEAIRKGLRKSIGDRKIEKEFEIRDIIDGLLTVAGYDFKKETPEEKFSAKGFRPDLTSKNLSTVIEVKLIDSQGDVSKSVEGLSADIEPYKKRFKNILFVVYDLGFVNDIEEYCKDFKKIDGVDILLIKR